MKELTALLVCVLAYFLYTHVIRKQLFLRKVASRSGTKYLVRNLPDQKDAANLLFHHITKTVVPASANGGDNPLGRGHADIGRNEDLFQRLNGIDIERPRSTTGFIGGTDDLIEASDELSLGAGKSLTNTAEHTHAMILVGLGLGSLAPQHERVDCGSNVGRILQHRRHLHGDRQLDPVALAQREGSVGCIDAFRDHLHPRDDFGERAPAGELETDVPIAAQTASAGQHEVSQPTQPGRRITLSSGSTGEPGDLRQASRNHCGQRIVPQVQSLDDASRDGNHVLHRAAEFDTHDITGPVQSEGRPTKFRLDTLGGGRIGRRGEHDRR